MNIDWFFRIPLRARALAILLVLTLVVVVTHKPFIRWWNCELTYGFLAHGTGHDPTGVGYDFSNVPRAIWPKWTPDGAHIAFVDERARNPRSELHIVAVDGSSLMAISDGGGKHTIDHSPSVSPDSSRIVYSTYNRVNDDSRYFEIETVALDGSDRRRLTQKAGYDIATEWLPGGGRIAFRRYATGECAHYFADFGIYTMKPDGSDVQRIVPEDRVGRGKRESIEEHVWSPDGRQVAVITEKLLKGEGELFYLQISLDVVDANGSNRKRLIEGRARLFGLAWSPDGTQIAFTRFQDDRSEMLTIDSNGSGPSRVLEVPVHGTLSWSPDGSQVMLTANVAHYGYPQYLYLVKTDGSDIRKLGSGLDADWSPDGSRIAFAVRESAILGNSSDVVLFTAALDGSHARVLVRRGENGVLEAVGAGRQGDGPIDIVPCRVRDTLCIQVVSGRLIFGNPCSGGFVAPDSEANAGLVRDCEALWELGRWAVEVRQRR